MNHVRCYSDLAVNPVLDLGSRSVGRRSLLASSGALAITALGSGNAGAQLANALNAATAVISGLDVLTDKIWPKVKRLFEGTAVHPSTASRVTNEVVAQLDKPHVDQVAIALNTTNNSQSGNVTYRFDQNFSQDYVDYCVCMAQNSLKMASDYEAMATIAAQQGQPGRADRLRTLANSAKANAQGWQQKATMQPYAGVQHLSDVPPSKPWIVPLMTPTPHMERQNVDKGEYFVARAFTNWKSSALSMRA